MIFISAMVKRNLEEMNREFAKRADFRRKLSILIYALGAILGMSLIGISIYADFEASLYDVTIATDGTLRPVTCPVFLGVNEAGLVKATVNNQTDTADEILLEAHTSQGQLNWLQEQDYHVALASGEKKQVSWEVYSTETANQSLILTKIIVAGNLSEETYKGYCGIVMLNLPGKVTGAQVFWVWFSSATFFLWGGIALWLHNRRSFTGRRMEIAIAIIGLGIFIQLGLIAAAVGYWELAALSFYIVILLIGVIIPHFFVNRGRTPAA